MASGFLQENNYLLRLVTEMADIAVWEYDFIASHMLRSNNHDKLYGLTWQTEWTIDTFLNSTHPDDRTKGQEFIQQSILPGGPDDYAFDFRVIWPDSTIHWLWVQGRVARRNESGQGILVRGVLIDITSRKAAENRIQRISNLYKALSEINQSIVRMETEETLFPLVCRMAVDFGGMALASIRQLNPKTNLLDAVESYGNGADYLKSTIISASDTVPEGRGPAGTAFRDGRNVIINRYLQCEMTKPWHEQAKRFGWGSSGTFPILRGGKTFAILGVYHGDEDAFDKEAIDLLDEMIRDISFSLDNFDRERESQRIRSDLLASERHFRAYFDRAMVGMTATSPTTGAWLEVNGALCKMLGYSKKELMQRTWADVTHPDDIEESCKAIQRILKGESDDFELNKRYIKQDGSVIHAHIASRAVHDENGVVDYLVTIADDITEIKNHQNQLEHLIHHDPLTGLPNRVLLNDRLDMAVSGAKRVGGNIAVCFMDLDGFKPINDTYGHATGDSLLIEVAKRLTSIARATDTVARLGGDEFILVLNGLSGEDECRHLLNRIMEIFSLPFQIDRHEVNMSSSIGVAMYPDHVTDGSGLLRHADQAMYIAKQKGRNRIHFFDAVNDHLAQVRSEGLSRIEMALQNGELILHYQPKINMSNGEVISMEALIRWQHPERGLLPPGEFLPLVENSEFEIRLSEWVIMEGMAQLDAWRKSGINIRVSVNLPARHLQAKGFIDFVFSAMSRYPDLKGRSITFEILETAALGDMGLAIQKMEDCIKQGIRFSIDDFGTGYASLSYLRRLPASTIKIDQSFIRDMLVDADDLSIVKGVISLADAFQKEVIAEGVETIEHGVKLLEMGCYLGQGYAISHPMNAENVTNWINEFKLPLEWKKSLH
jgi:diguanylate cyclase (GGDEF)-like protein/PAS domain S-box-containing protein